MRVLKTLHDRFKFQISKLVHNFLLPSKATYIQGEHEQPDGFQFSTTNIQNIGSFEKTRAYLHRKFVQA